MSTPREDGFRMPAPWEPHERCWMAWPSREELWGPELDLARTTVAALAGAIADFEPVTVIARPDLTAGVSLYLRQGVPVLPLPHDDCRIRDTAPAFLVNGIGGLAAVAFRFDAWGNAWPDQAQDARLAGRLTDHVGARAYTSQLALDGTQLHHDGHGTALLCAESVLSLSRNPGVSQTEIETELSRQLAIEQVIWLPHALMRFEARIMPDAPYCYLRPGLVLAAVTEDANDPDHAGLAANLETLRAASDARGQKLEVLTVPLPRRVRGAERPIPSYTSLYLANGGAVLPAFNDPADKTAFRTVSGALPDRSVVQVDVSGLVPGGGSIYAVTREQPAA